MPYHPYQTGNHYDYTFNMFNPSYQPRIERFNSGNNVSKEWEQCGGKDWTGSQDCQSGCHCVEKNPDYFICQPEEGNYCETLMSDHDLVIDKLLDERTIVKVIYYSDWRSSESSEIFFMDVFKNCINAGYNVINFTFYVPKMIGKPDNGGESSGIVKLWEVLPDLSKKKCLTYLHSKDAALILSCGGGTKDNVPIKPDSDTMCKYTWLDTIGQYAYKNFYDGVDIYVENVEEGEMKQNCLDWLADCVSSIRDFYKNNNSKCIITSTPQEVYFRPKNVYNSYTLNYLEYEKDNSVTDADGYIDWYNIKFYNQNDDQNTEKTLIGDINNYELNDEECGYNTNEIPNCTANGNGEDIMVSFLVSHGVPKKKIVIGKCGKGDKPCCDDKYYVKGEKLLKWVETAGLKGVMYWEWDCGGNVWLTQTMFHIILNLFNCRLI